MLSILIPLLGFWIVFALSVRCQGFLSSLKDKAAKSWVLDVTGLFIQGWLFPLLQAFLLLPLFRLHFPGWEAGWDLPFWLAAPLSFVLVDYLYYWNHRVLHSALLWPWHRVHHSAETMDIFVSSRNGFVTHFFICYVWIHSSMIFLLKDDVAYLLGVALTSALDLWRHSPHRPQSSLIRVLGRVLVLPADHAWHHGMRSEGQNFGANLKIWDRLHGTWRDAPPLDCEVGDSAQLQWKHMLLPMKSD